MKKTVTFFLTVCLILSAAGTALAFPLDLTGDFRFQLRLIDDKIGPDHTNDFNKNFTEFRARLNFSGKVDPDTTFFGRFSVRNNEGLGEDVRSTGEFDQFGVKAKYNDWTFSIGRQALALGLGTQMDIGSDAAGANNFFDGVVASTKWGKADVRLFGGRNTSNIAGLTKAQNPLNVWYGVDVNIKPDDKLSVGMVYARQKPDPAGSVQVNRYAVNTVYNFDDKLSLSGEYARSSLAGKNSGYIVAASYALSPKSSLALQYNHVQENAVDGFNGGIGNGPYPLKGADLPGGYKGYTVTYNQTLTKTLSFQVIYMDLKALAAGQTGSDQEIAAGLTWSF